MPPYSPGHQRIESTIASHLPARGSVGDSRSPAGLLRPDAERRHDGPRAKLARNSGGWSPWSWIRSSCRWSKRRQISPAGVSTNRPTLTIPPGSARTISLRRLRGTYRGLRGRSSARSHPPRSGHDQGVFDPRDAANFGLKHARPSFTHSPRLEAVGKSRKRARLPAKLAA